MKKLACLVTITVLFVITGCSSSRHSYVSDYNDSSSSSSFKKTTPECDYSCRKRISDRKKASNLIDRIRNQ